MRELIVRDVAAAVLAFGDLALTASLGRDVNGDCAVGVVDVDRGRADAALPPAARAEPVEGAVGVVVVGNVALLHAGFQRAGHVATAVVLQRIGVVVRGGGLRAAGPLEVLGERGGDCGRARLQLGELREEPAHGLRAPADALDQLAFLDTGGPGLELVAAAGALHAAGVPHVLGGGVFGVLGVDAVSAGRLDAHRHLVGQ